MKTNWNKTILQSIIASAMMLTAFGCSSDKPPRQPTVGECKPSGANLVGFELVQSEDATPGFTEDILPILASAETGKAYKCTTCHAAYNTYANVANTAKVDAIIAESQSGEMPLNGDKMAAEDLELIKRWKAAGFPKNRKTENPTTPTNPPPNPGNEDPDNGSGPKVTLISPGTNPSANDTPPVNPGNGGDPFDNNEQPGDQPDTGTQTRPGC